VTSTTADAADVRSAYVGGPAPTATDQALGHDTSADSYGADGADRFGRPNRGPFLPVPPPLDPRARRFHRIVLGLLMAAGFLIGTVWTFTTVVWNPIDEATHFGYVESLATGEGVPTVGVDLLRDETIASVKQSPNLAFRSNPYRPTSEDPNWGGSAHQYEAVHGPTYYALMVPAYWAGRPFGTIGSLYAIRFATIALTLLAVPLTWMLARRLFPDRPVIWLLAPALLVTVNSLSPGTVSNDALVLGLSIATILVFLRALNEPRRWVPAVSAGALFGLTIVTKMTSLVLVPFLTLAFLAWVAVQRPKLLGIARFVALVAVGAIVTFAPWLAWNLRTYRATSAATVVDGITGASLPESTLGLDAIIQHASVARPGVWLNQLLTGGSYQTIWELVLVASLVLGSLAAIVRRRWRDLAVLLWCGSALALAFASMEVIVFVLFDGTGGPMGRHLIAALAPTMVMIAAATVLVVGTRWAPPLLASVVAFTLVLQVPITQDFVGAVYLRASIDHRLAPVVYQDWADTLQWNAKTITIEVDCPVESIGIGFMDTTLGTDPNAVPATLVVRTPSATITAGRGGSVYDIATYSLATPASGPITVELPEGAVVRSAGGDRDPNAAFGEVTNGIGADEDPVVTAYCPDPDPDAASFARIYPVGHPEIIGLRMLRGAPVVLAAAGVAVAVLLLVVAGRNQVRARGGNEPPAAPPPA